MEIELDQDQDQDQDLEQEQEQDQEKTVVCTKGNILLTSYILSNKKAYSLTYDFKDLDPNKVNIKSLFGPDIYALLEKMNPDLIEKFYILNQINDNETDVLILLKHFAKEIGIKQKYVLFRITRGINHHTNTVIFYNKDLSSINEDIVNKYLQIIKLDTNKYEQMFFNYGKTIITLKNLQFNELMKLNNNENFISNLDINFEIKFQLTIKDELPIYMEDLMGLMFKKLFYNLKQFIDNLNNLCI